MSFFNTLNKKTKGAVRKMFQGFYSQTWMIPPNLNTQDYLTNYGKIGWLFACTSRIANDVANAEWKAYRKGEEDPLKTSKSLELLLNPNPYFSLFQIMELTQMYMDLVGKCFWYIARDRANRPAQVWVISPLNMTILPDKDNYIQGFIYQGGAERVPLSTDEVIMFKYQDPSNPYNGISPAKAAAIALESDKYSSEWNRNFFYNNAEPQGIVSFPEGVEEDDFNEWQKKWNNKYGGLGNGKKTAFIRGGEVNYTAIQISQKDMDFYNLRLSNRDEILAIFGVPKSVVGIIEDVNRANAEASEYTYMKHTVSPKLKRIQDVLNNEFVKLFCEDGVELRHTDVVPENKDFIKSIIDTQIDKSITKNEARNILNKLLGIKLEPLEGGDVIWQPMGIQPMGIPMPTMNNEQDDESIDEEENNIEQQDKSLKKKELNLRKTKIKTWLKNLDKEQYWNNFVVKTEKKEKDVSKAWNRVFNLQKEQILKGLKDKKSIKTKYEVKDDKGSVVGTIKGIDTKSVLSFLNDPKHKDEINKLVSPLISEILKDEAQDSLDDIGLDVDFNLHNPQVQKWIKNYCGKEIKQINDTTRNLIKDQIEKCESEGASIDEICDAISEYCDNMADYRVRNIARTETIGASNQGALEGYRQSDVVSKKEWLTAIDERTRQAHIEANGQQVNLDEEFEVDGEELNAPGDQNGSPENICNCRCTVLPVVDD